MRAQVVQRWGVDLRRWVRVWRPDDTGRPRLQVRLGRRVRRGPSLRLRRVLHCSPLHHGRRLRLWGLRQRGARPMRTRFLLLLDAGPLRASRLASIEHRDDLGPCPNAGGRSTNTDTYEFTIRADHGPGHRPPRRTPETKLEATNLAASAAGQLATDGRRSGAFPQTGAPWARRELLRGSHDSRCLDGSRRPRRRAPGGRPSSEVEAVLQRRSE
jgi:hypothetical protein